MRRFYFWKEGLKLTEDLWTIFLFFLGGGNVQTVYSSNTWGAIFGIGVF